MMKSIVLMFLCLVGAVASVSAASTEVEQRVEYTTSLNSMASVVMNWYGSLIVKDTAVSFAETDNRWDEFRSHYPTNISQIKITSSDLTKLDDNYQYQFKVNSLISYNTANGEQGRMFNETFIFYVPLFSLPVIKRVSIDKVEEALVVNGSEFNRSYYKSREFAYSWLAYLDGVDMAPSLSASQWIDKVDYKIKIGNKIIQGPVLSALEQRKQYLAKGGHLLRSIDVKKQQDKESYLLIIIAEWKGVNQDGKSVLAKVRQEIEYKILADNSWQVLSIDEQHLLPDIAPWIGLLC